MNTKKKNHSPVSVDQEMGENSPSESLRELMLRSEDEVIHFIKKKATKETLKSLAPLLEKLELALKELENNKSASTVHPPHVVDYDEQLKNVHETTIEKIKAKELKITERVKKIQARISSMHK